MLHDDTLTYLVRLADWMSLGLEYARTGQDSKRVEANNVIPEINARSSGVYRGLGKRPIQLPAADRRRRECPIRGSGGAAT